MIPHFGRLPVWRLANCASIQTVADAKPQRSAKEQDRGRGAIEHHPKQTCVQRKRASNSQSCAQDCGCVLRNSTQVPGWIVDGLPTVDRRRLPPKRTARRKRHAEAIINPELKASCSQESRSMQSKGSAGTGHLCRRCPRSMLAMRQSHRGSPQRLGY